MSTPKLRNLQGQAMCNVDEVLWVLQLSEPHGVNEQHSVARFQESKKAIRPALIFRCNLWLPRVIVNMGLGKKCWQRSCEAFILDMWMIRKLHELHYLAIVRITMESFDQYVYIHT